MSKFDALALEVEKPQRMTILHPVTRQPLRDPSGKEAYIDLYSGDSEIARRHDRAISRRRLAMRGRGKISPEELEADATGALVALTAGWYLVGLNGSVIDVQFSADSARELYETPAMAWIRAQADEFAGDRANFSTAASQTS